MLLDNLPILVHTVRKFVACPLVTEIVVAIRPKISPGQPICCSPNRNRSRFVSWRAVNRGSSRSRTRWRLSRPTRIWLRSMMPFGPSSTSPTIERVIQEARETGRRHRGHRAGGYRQARASNKIRQTLTRERLILTQTPQVFRYDLIRQAFRESARRRLYRYR